MADPFSDSAPDSTPSRGLSPGNSGAPRGLAAVEWSALLAIILIGLALRLWGVDRNSFWGDEISQSWAVTAPSFAECLGVVHWQTAMTPLDAILGRLWVQATGSPTDFAMRLYEVLIGTLAVIAMWLCGREIGGRATGLIAAALLALSSFHIEYSQEFRPYALLTLVATLFLFSLVRMLHRPDRWGSALLFAGMALVGYYTHLFMAFVVLGGAIVILIDGAMLAGRAGLGALWKGRGRLYLRLAMLAVTVAVLCLPWFLYDTLGEMSASAQDFGVEQPAPWLFYIDVFFHLSGSGDLALLVCTLAVIAAVVWAVRTGEAVTLGLALSLPVMIALNAWVNSLRGYRLILRQFIYLYPFWLTLAALGLHRAGVLLWEIARRRPRLRPAAAGLTGVVFAALVWSNVPAIRAAHLLDVKEDWRATARALQLVLRDDRDVLVVMHFAPYIRHYWTEVDGHLWQGNLITAAEVNAARAQGKRVYVFFGKPTVLPGHNDRQREELRDIPQVRLDLWDTGSLICIPEETEHPEATMIHWLQTRLTPWEHDSAFVLTSLAREGVLKGQPVSQISTYLDRIGETDLADHRILHGLGQALRAAGADAQANAIYEEEARLVRMRISSTYESRGYHLIELSGVMRSLGRTRRCVPILRHALRFAPPLDRPYFQYRLAQGLMSDDPKSPEAVDLLERAIAANPTLPYLWIALAQGRRNREEWPALVRTMARADELCPSVKDSLAPHAAACLEWLFKSDTLSDAEREALLAQLQPYIESDSPNTAMARAVLAQRRGDWQASLDASRRAVELDPASGAAQGLLASAAGHLGLTQEAKEAWTRGACLITGEDAPALWSEARTALQTQGVSMAEALAEGDATAWQCHLVARWLSRQSLWDEALAAWDQALAKGPPHVEYHFGRHRCLMHLGRVAEALAAAEAARTLNPEQPWGEIYIGDALDALGRHDEARTHWQAAVDLNFNEDSVNSARQRLERTRTR
jgi:mannosyltransferase